MTDGRSFSDEPLTEAERIEVRRMLEDDRAAKRIWAMFRAAAVWLVAISAGFVTFYDSVSAILHKWFIR